MKFGHDLNDERRARYRGLLDAPPDAMGVVSPDGEMVRLNIPAELLGWKIKSIPGPRL